MYSALLTYIQGALYMNIERPRVSSSALGTPLLRTPPAAGDGSPNGDLAAGIFDINFYSAFVDVE